MQVARLCLGLLLPAAAALEFAYHHQEQMEAFLRTVARNYSSITRLHSIGKSVQDKNLNQRDTKCFTQDHQMVDFITRTGIQITRLKGKDTRGCGK